MRALLIALAVSLAAVAQPVLAQDTTEAGSVVYMDDNASMNAAVAEARRTLPVFWRYYSPDADPGLKVQMSDGDGGFVHVWFHDIERRGDKLAGRLVNDAPDLEYRPGDTVEFEESAVSDWSIKVDNRLLGNYTTRVMLKDIPAKDADYFRTVLTKDPTQPDTPVKP